MANVSRVHKEISNCVRRYQGMNDPKEKTMVHMIDNATDRLISRPLVYNVPRVGEEIRLDASAIYVVTQVVWCYDEPESHWSRANIGVNKI